MDEIGREIRRLREAKGWSQAKLAVDSGIGVSAVSLIETGKRNPSATTLAKIAEALGVGVADLFPLGQAPLFRRLPEQTSLEEQRNPLRPWAEHVQRIADRIRHQTDDPHSPAFRDPYAAQFFVEEKEREAADLFFFHFGEEEGPYDDEALSVELLSAFEELLEALNKARYRADQMEAKRDEIAAVKKQQRRTAAAVAERERVSAPLLEKRGA